MLQKLIRNKTILAVASILFGLWLMIFRTAALNLVIRVAGYGLLAIGAAYLVYYFMTGRGESIRLGYGVVAAIAGLLVLSLGPALINFLPVLAGLVLILNGGADLYHLWEQDRSFRPVLIMPAATALLGLLVVFHPGAVAGAVVLVAGAAFVLNGLADLNIIRKFW